MKPTEDEQRILRGLHVLREQYGISAVHAYLIRGGGDEILSLDFEVNTDDPPEAVTHLQREIDMRVIDPLLDSDYIARSEIGADSYRLWITREGLRLVERDFEEALDLPASQIIMAINSSFGNAAISNQGTVTITDSPVSQQRSEVQQLVAGLTQLIEASQLSQQQKEETQSVAIQLAAELAKPNPNTALLDTFVRSVATVSAVLGIVVTQDNEFRALSDLATLELLDYVYRISEDPHFEPELQLIITDQADILFPQLREGQQAHSVPRELFGGRETSIDRIEKLQERGYIHLIRGPATVHWLRITDTGKGVARGRVRV